jgi:hypothetical protein
VLLRADPGRPPAARSVRVGENARVEATALTAAGVSFDAGGLGLSLHDSVVAGGGACGITVGPGAAWAADRNLYDVGSLRVGGTAYAPAAFDAYRRAGGQDAGSRWERLDAGRLLTGAPRLSLAGRPVGADVARLPGAGVRAGRGK